MFKVRLFESRFLRWAVRIMAGGVILLIVAALASLKLLEATMPNEKLRPFLEREFTRFLKRELTIEHVEWGWRPHLALIGKNVRLHENDHYEMAYSPQVDMFVAIKPLLNKKIEFMKIEFHEPIATLRVRKNRSMDLAAMIREIRAALDLESPNISTTPATPMTPLPYVFKMFTIVNGHLHIVDETLKPEPLNAVFLVNARGDIQGVPRKRYFPFTFSAKLENSPNGFVQLNGKLGQGSTVTVTTHDLPLRVFDEHVAILRDWDGRLDLQARLRNTPNGWLWTASGTTRKLTSHRPSPVRIERVDYQLSNNGLSTATVALGGERLSGEVTATATSLQDIRTNIAITSNRLSILGEPFDQTQMTLRRTNDGSLYFDNVSALGLGGSIQAKAAFVTDGRTMPARFAMLPPDFFWEWNFENINLARLSAFVHRPQAVTGTGSCRGNLSGNFQNLKSPDTRGTITLSMKDGTVAGVPGLVKTLSMLNVTSLIKQFKHTSAEGFPFQSASATVLIRDGLARFDPPAMFSNETMEVAFMGHIDLVKKDVNGNLVVRFLTFIGEVVRAVPGVRTVLIGNQKSIVPLWIDISGPLKDPKINVRQSKWFSDPILSTIRRLFGLPAKAVKAFRNADDPSN